MFYFDQFQRLSEILFSAAEEEGLVDPHKIEAILKAANKNAQCPDERGHRLVHHFYYQLPFSFCYCSISKNFLKRNLSSQEFYKNVPL